MKLQRPFWIAATLALTGAVTTVILSGHSAARAEEKSEPKTAAYVPHKKGTLTFTKDIAPILLQECASCHRPGEIGPFSLLSYQDARKRAAQLAAVTQNHYMPPWHADSHGEFQNERRLTPDQIGMIQQWADEGAAEGDPAAMPATPKFSQGWMLGEPDAVFQPEKSYTLAAEGADVYRCFVLPTHFSADRYISALEVRPGNSKIVHHVIAYLDSQGNARKLQEANTDGNPGYTAHGGIGVAPTGSLGGWAPGNLPRLLPDGVGVLLPKGADIVLQVHYHKTGKTETDRTRFGLYFAKKPVDKRLRILPLAYLWLNIPPGDANYKVESSMPVLADATVLNVMPHMHLLGKEMTVTATLPDGAQKSLIHVPDYDFNWQTTYVYKTPLKLPQGTKLDMTARYDNSASNPRNPTNPPRRVTWGEQTTDEMCIAFISYTVDKEHLTQGITVPDFLDFLGRRGQRARNGENPDAGTRSGDMPMNR